MARAKAKKTAAKKPARNLAPKVNHGIPEGFTMPASAQIPTWDFEKNSTIQGEVVSIREVVTKPRKGEKKGGKTRIMAIKTESGSLFAVWESAALRSLFDEVAIGGQVFIRFEGTRSFVPKGGGAKQKIKEYTAAYDNSDAPKSRRR